MATPLYVRSVYSLLNSLCHIRGIISKCKEYGYTSCALVDKNVLSGARAFYKACKKENIKPLFGLEVDININERIFSFILMAKNDNGFRNLMKLSTYINTHDNKVIDKDLLDKYKDDNFIILLSDNMPLRIAVDKNEDINNALAIQEEYFGNNYLVGLIDHNIKANLNSYLIMQEYLQTNNIKTLALTRTLYFEEDDYIEYEILRCIDEKRTLDNLDLIVDNGRYFYSKEKLDELYDSEDILNTDILASKCNVEMKYETSLPEYKNKYNVSSKEYLINLCNTVLSKRFNNKVPKEYSNRLKEELDIITKMNFEDYFLIVYDFILYAKKNNILVGPGRGSAAGSLVSYCLGITEIDPIKYGLLFERFLNPERISMPDIDTDFPDDKRDEVIEYVRDKYGKDKVAHIITYGTLKAKQVLRDVGRVLNYRPRELDSICKLIPFDANNPMTLDRAFETNNLFRNKISSEERYQKLFEIARKLEGNPRHESTHAAGIIMSNKPIEEVVPLIKIEDDIYSSQYTMEHLEEFGLIKMDFLGIRNLSIIAEVVEDINREEEFDIRNIPLDDQKTFELISKANTLGVFQLESQGMKSLVKRMRPRNFNEIGMTIALFRPGPMDNIPLFLENRSNPNNIKYMHPDLKDILEETYGIIIYQEQIMTIARKMAGFTYGKADILRKAMSKKKADELISLKEDFIKGCINNGYDEKLSNDLYDLVLKFANYGFNKSHSVAYALVAYKMAYLKANYPSYFYKAVLNGVIGSETKTFEYISEYLSSNHKIKGISINYSSLEYEVKEDELIMPLLLCKDVGRVSALKIIEERNNNGLYNDFIDTICRLVRSGVEKNVIENLIYAGAFDELDLTRNTMIKALPNVLMYASAHKGEISLMDELDDKPLINNYPDNKMVLADNEKNVLGFYFSFNPITEIRRIYNINTKPLNEIAKTLGYQKGFGLITRLKRHLTSKKREAMAFVDIVDETGNLSLVIMPDLYRIFESELQEDRFIYFEGKIEKEDSCLVKKINIIKEEEA